MAGARLCRGGHGARRAGGDRQAAAGAFPQRHCAAERSGLGADQRIVLRLLAAGTGLRVRCRRPRARLARSGRRSALSAVPVAGGRRGRRRARSPRHFRRTGRDHRHLDGRCLAAGRVRHQSAVLGSGPVQADDQRPRHVRCGGLASGGSPRRRARTVQPQTRHRAGQPVAVRAVFRRPALRQPRLDRRRCGDRHGRAAGRRACFVDHLRPGAGVLRLAFPRTGRNCWPCSPSAPSRWRR